MGAGDLALHTRGLGQDLGSKDLGANLTFYADNSALQRQGAQGLGQDLGGGDLSSKDPNIKNSNSKTFSGADLANPNAKDPNNQSAINKAIYLAQNDFNTSRPMSAEEAMTLDSVIVSDEQSADEAGLDSVYENDQVTLFKTKKDLESYRGVNVSDLLSGFEGVYSGDARNSGALDPNIRGVQGQGRIPITVDNTEQSISIWRGFAGVSNRNYLDPSLIAGVKVQKGPSLNRSLKGGVGGSISMRTLDPRDIVKNGEKWGVEIKLESATNSIKQRKNPFSKIGQDYREMGDGAGNVLLGEWAIYFRSGDRLEPRSSKGKRYNPLNDKAARIAIATKQENFESLLAYAYGNKGNYFAGRNGANKYGNGLTVGELQRKFQLEGIKSIEDPAIPFIAAFYKPNYEVANTNMQTKSLLFKNNWFFGDYKLKFMYRNMSLKAGEIMPSRLVVTLGSFGTVMEWPQAHTKQNALDLGLEYKPPFHPYINFEANVWSVFNDSKTNTSGGSPGDVLWEDKAYSEAYGIYYRCKTGQGTDTAKCNAHKKPPKPTPGLPKELFTTQEAQAQYNKDNHHGLNLSNKFSFSDELDLSLMVSFNYEDLDSDNVYGKLSLSGKYKHLEDQNKISYVTNFAGSGPRKGKRHELNIGTNLNYKPAEWLALNAGLKFTNYETKDDYYSEYAKRQYKENKQNARVGIGKAFTYYRLYTAGKKAKYDAILAKGTTYKKHQKKRCL
ncbi:MAG: TonB-dependent receptor plug domain-containing protein [Helicobacteraceae bacterium]